MSQLVPITLWSRYQDGAEQVTISPAPTLSKGGKPGKRTFTVGGPGSGGTGDRPLRTYQSARSLLVDITKHPKARNWTLDRYFGVGRFETPNAQQDLSLTILEVIDPSNALELRPQAPAILIIDPAALALPQVLGIDLVNRSGEVTKLLFAGFGHAIHACGYDAEDVLQEVFAGILVRNRGKCAFDPRKASFGHYVHMVCECVMSNYHRKQNRLREKEQVGAPGRGEDGEPGLVDVQDSMSANAMCISMAGSPLDNHAAADLFKYISMSPKGQSVDAIMALQVLPMVQEGYGRSEIADKMGVSKAAVSRALTFLRKSVKAWLGLAA